MIKQRELSDPTSCLNRAQDDEMIFVLLGRDAAAPVAIRAWAEERIRLGKNGRDDVQIVEALDCAARMVFRARSNEIKSHLADCNGDHAKAREILKELS